MLLIILIRKHFKRFIGNCRKTCCHGSRKETVFDGHRGVDDDDVDDISIVEMSYEDYMAGKYKHS